MNLPNDPFYKGVSAETEGAKVTVTIDDMVFSFTAGNPSAIYEFKATTTQGRIDELVCMVRHWKRLERPLEPPPILHDSERVGAADSEPWLRKLPGLTLAAIKSHLNNFDAKVKKWKQP